MYHYVRGEYEPASEICEDILDRLAAERQNYYNHLGILAGEQFLLLMNDDLVSSVGPLRLVIHPRTTRVNGVCITSVYLRRYIEVQAGSKESPVDLVW